MARSVPPGSDSEALYAMVRSALAHERGSSAAIAGPVLCGEGLRRSVMANHLVPLLSPWAEQLGLSEDDAAWLAQAHTRNTLRALRAATQAHEMQRRLEDDGVHGLILKGSPLAVRTTGSLAGRQFADIDFLVDLRHFGHAEETLQAHGVEHLGHAHDSPVSGPFHRWVRWTQNQSQYRLPGGFPVELHWRLAAIHRLLPIDFDTLWAQRSRVVSGDFGFTTLGPVHELLFVAVHGAKHGFSSLHWLIDVIRLLRTTSDETWRQVVDQATARGAGQAMALAVIWANRFEPNRRGIPLRPRSRRRVEDLADRVRPAEESTLRGADRLGFLARLNQDPRYVANQVARTAVPARLLGSVDAPPPLVLLYLPIRQVRKLTGRAPAEASDVSGARARSASARRK